jgi:hypothetical protein
MTFATLIANYMVHVKLMYRFIYSMLLNVVVLVFHFVVDYFLLNSYSNFDQICQLLMDYYTNYPDKAVVGKDEAVNICYSHKFYYQYFIIAQASLIVTKMLSIYFACRAHISLIRKIRNIKKSDIKIKEN